VQRAEELYRERGLVVVTVGIDPDAARTVRELGSELPVTEDPGSRWQDALGARGHPSFVFVDREARVVGTAIGYRDWLSPAGRAFLDGFTATAAR
jgi:hypothetical protein